MPARRRPPYSLGLRWWQVQAFIVLPQALRIVVPGIINTVVDLFKDTTLVTIIGLFDLLGAVEQALKDPAWLGFATEGYVFSAWCSSSAAMPCRLMAAAWSGGSPAGSDLTARARTSNYDGSRPVQTKCGFSQPGLP